MRTPVRAVVAVALLVGYYVLAAGVAVGGVVLIGAALVSPEPGAVVLGVLAGLAVFGVVAAVASTVRLRPGRPEGIARTRDDEPALWAMIDELAATVGTRSPDELWLDARVNAGVHEETRWLGLSVLRRRMMIGLPLVDAVTVDQLRAVLAHELGHYAGRDSQLGALTYRGSVALLETLQRVRGTLIAELLFRGYAAVYFRVSSAVSRAQEAAADRAAVQVAGRAASAGALREIHVIDTVWEAFEQSYVEPGERYGLAPADLFGGFRTLLLEPGRSAALDRLRRDPPAPERNPYDSHPPLAERLAALERCPEPEGLAADHRPAFVLLADRDRVREELRTARFPGATEVLDWAELIPRAYAAQAAEMAERLRAATSRVTGDPAAGLGAVLDALERGLGRGIAFELLGEPASLDELPALQAGVLHAHVAAAAIDALLRVDGVRCELSWTGAPFLLRDPSGAEIDLSPVLAPLAGEDATGTAGAGMRGIGGNGGIGGIGAGGLGGLDDRSGEREDRRQGDGAPPEDPPPAGTGPDRTHAPLDPARLRAWLARHGVPLAGPGTGAPAGPPLALHAVLIEVVVEDRPYDVLVTTSGMLFVPAPRGPVAQRTDALLAARPGELLDRPGSQFVPADRVLRAAWRQTGRSWRLGLVMGWSDEAGVHEDVVRVGGRSPGAPPAEVLKALRTLLGDRLVPSYADDIV